MTCLRDTDGDGNCGSRWCLVCGDGARAAAVEAERVVNTDQPVLPGHLTGQLEEPVQVDDVVVAAAADPASVRVSITSFSRSVEVEAPGTLDRVSQVALQLWRETAGHGPIPVGPMGFMMGEPSEPTPPEMATRVLEPLYERGNQRAA